MTPLEFITPQPFTSDSEAIEAANRVASLRHDSDLAKATHASTVETLEAELGLKLGLLEEEENALLGRLKLHCSQHRERLFSGTQSTTLGVHVARFQKSPGKLEAEDEDLAIEQLLTCPGLTDAQRRRWLVVKPGLNKKAILSDLKTAAKAVLEGLGLRAKAEESWKLETL